MPDFTTSWRDADYDDIVDVMSYDYRPIILTAIGLAFLTGFGTATYRLYADTRPRETPYHYQPFAKPRRDQPALIQATPAGYHPHCADPQDRDEAQLCAQWAAAEQSAEAMRLAALNTRLGILSLVGIAVATGLLIWTLIETRHASRHKLRAYVFADRARLVANNAGGRYPAGVAAATVTMKNSGRTPAFDLVHRGNVVIHPVRVEDALIASQIVDPHKGFIPPGGELSISLFSGHKPGWKELLAIRRGVTAVYVYGSIQYRDAFYRYHSTDYRFIFTGKWPPNPATLINFATSGNNAT